MRPTGQRRTSAAKARASSAAAAPVSATPSRRGSGSGEVSLYDEVTRKIIAQLEAGRLPWVQPWGRAGGAALSLPRNGITGRRYSGVNILLLWGAVVAHGYPSQGWLTFKQALAAGGCVRKGERGTSVVYADRFTPRAEQERAARDGDAPGKVAFLKRFTVFNLAQCEGLVGADPEPAPLPERQVVPHAEALIVATGADFRIGGNLAFYSPSHDFVQVPPQPAFGDQINYYRTAFHELSHWTGHGSRLDRDQSGVRGGKAYAREELVAEMGAAFLCASLGIVPTVRHADYIGSWLEVVREDNRAIFRAASQASKAADFLLAFRPDAPPPAADRVLLAAQDRELVA
ncbi:ArdC family protein [Caulobacter sp. LARHSG274]